MDAALDLLWLLGEVLSIVALACGAILAFGEMEIVLRWRGRLSNGPRPDTPQSVAPTDLRKAA
ncbi:MAG TPA: hypothetical protein VFK15_07265 [Burkholderiales bacterium]|jgi:hypothetical protein|nr:hypothetical protein [Burkholderiales bacterium]